MAEVQISYLYLPSSEQRLIQSHGCPNRLFVCKLNVGKPEKKCLRATTLIKCKGSVIFVAVLSLTTTSGLTHVILKQWKIKLTLLPFGMPRVFVT